MTPDTSDDSRRFGLAPSIIGLLIGFAIIWLMFELATGFA